MQEKNTIKSIRLKIIIKYYNSINKQLNLRNITRNGRIQETSGTTLYFVMTHDNAGETLGETLQVLTFMSN